MGINVFDGEISWKRRLAIVLSFLWLAIFTAIGTSEQNGFAIFVTLGLFPVAALWGIGWVWSAYRRQRTPNEGITSPPLVAKNQTAPLAEVAATYANPDAVSDSKPIGPGAALPQMPLPLNEEPECLPFPLATPWPRAFARIFDIWWESILIGGAASFVLGWVNQHGSEYLFGIIFWLFALLFLPFVLLFDAAVFRLAGNTPGKAMLGIRVASLRGTPLEFGQYLRRNFFLWSSGLGFGIPIVVLFTLWRQEKRLRKGQQTSYDEKIGSRVWSKPIGEGRKFGFAVAFISLFAVMAMLNFQVQEAEREAARVAVGKNYSWVNPVTNISATVAPQWKYSSMDNADGQKVHAFTEHTGHAMVVIGVEYLNAVSLHDYATAFSMSSAGKMSFNDGGKFYEQGGRAYWEATGTMPEAVGTRLHVKIIKVDGAFWRQVTIQSKPFDLTDPLLEPLQSALWRTAL